MLATRILQTFVFAFAPAGTLPSSMAEAVPVHSESVSTVEITAKRLGSVGKIRRALQDAQAAAKQLAANQAKPAGIPSNLG
jgi:hypothetical protein